MITKPEDAIPGYCNNYNKAERMFVGPTQKVFTAAECAEIAKAYLAAYLKEKRALLRPDSEHKKAAANLKAWRAKFAEWEGK